MESEVTTLKRRYLETRKSYKEIKREMREQREKTRQIISACGGKLQEKENQVLKIRTQRDEELARIARELIYLQSNMLKERKRLETVISEQALKIRAQEIEIERLRKTASSAAASKHHRTAVTPTSDMDTLTTSSEDGGSPKSSFNKSSIPPPPKTNVVENVDNDNKQTLKEIKNRENFVSSTNNNKRLTPPALPPRRTSSTSSSSSTASSGSSSGPHKPPVPSRDGVNRKLMGNGRAATRLDEFEPNVGHVTGDEGFCSSHEDQQYNSNRHHHHHHHHVCSPSRQLTNHRDVQKPSDIKYRSKLRSVSNLGALEEHQVISNQEVNSPITTVTYLDYF